MRLTPLVVATLAALPAAAATGGVPLALTQTGFLLDGSDNPVTDTALAMTFRIYDQSGPVTGQQLQWSATCNVPVLRGYYAAVLGAGECAGAEVFDTADVPPGAPRFVEVTIAGTPLLPRLAITPVPMAAVATTSIDTQALVARLASTGTLNDAANPVDWTQVKNVPAALADGTDADTTYTATGGLELVDGAFRIATGGVANAQLANAGLTLTAGDGLTGGGLVTLGGSSTLAIATGGVTSALLASDAASIAKVSAGAIVVDGANVGIGTTSPASALQVAGTVSATTFAGSGAQLTGISGAAIGTGSPNYVWNNGGAAQAAAINISGAATVGGGLVANKQIRSVPASGSVFANTGATIDWNNGNVQTTSASCGPMTFSNMQEGGAYTLVVTGATAGTCTFTQTAPDALTAFKFQPANGATTASTTTVFTFLRAGNIAYVSWISGF